jgi:hypothetical protein
MQYTSVNYSNQHHSPLSSSSRNSLRVLPRQDFCQILSGGAEIDDLLPPSEIREIQLPILPKPYDKMIQVACSRGPDLSSILAIRQVGSCPGTFDHHDHDPKVMEARLCLVSDS